MRDIRISGIEYQAHQYYEGYYKCKIKNNIECIEKCNIGLQATPLQPYVVSPAL